MLILPKTRTGKASVLLIVAMFALFLLGMRFFAGLYASVPAGGTILRDLVARPGLAVSMLAGFASGVAACAVGLVAIFKRRERAVLTVVATSIGVLLVLFLSMELLFTH